MNKVNNPTFWDEKYKADSIPWDIGSTAVDFIEYFKDCRHIECNMPISACVLGCGKGHDAFHLANLGYKVYAIDFSESAINYCNEKKKIEKIENIHFIQCDFFDLINEEKWKNTFDYIVEHTFFCAIDPKRRNEYLEVVKYLLKPKGKLVGLFVIRSKELSGPPYGSDIGEIKSLFQSDFKEQITSEAKCIHGFDGKEVFAIFAKKL